MLGVEKRGLGELCLAGKIIMLFFAFYVNVCYFAAADGVCEPSLFVIGLIVVIALFLLLCPLL